MLNKADNERLCQISLLGGEPRCHPRLLDVLEEINQFYNWKGVNLAAFSDLKDRLPNRMGRQDIEVSLCSNGLGMNSLTNIGRIIRELGSHGVSKFRLSTDPAHKEYAQAHGIKIDYDSYSQLVDPVFSSNNQLRQRLGISSSIDLNISGNGAFVLPIGRAKKMNWPERLRLASDLRFDGVDSAKQSLTEELDSWQEVICDSRHYSRYCDVTRFVSGMESPKHKLNLLRTRHNWNMVVNPDLSAFICFFNILPPLGNLHDLNPAQIFYLATHNRLYQIIAKEGPHGLAKRLTGESNGKIRNWFRERIPCGLCEDLMERYPEEITQLSHDLIPNPAVDNP